MPMRKLFYTIVLCAGACVLPAGAHHSHGNYILDEYTLLEGTVREVHWINPHTWIYLEVEDDNGEPQMWALEGGGVAAIMRRGWTRESVVPGDTINVRCHQLRDLSLGCLLGYVQPEGGEEKEWD